MRRCSMSTSAASGSIQSPTPWSTSPSSNTPWPASSGIEKRVSEHFADDAAVREEGGPLHAGRIVGHRNLTVGGDGDQPALAAERPDLLQHRPPGLVQRFLPKPHA